MELKGKVALVTGGGSGIGQAVAIALAKAGASVSIVGLSEANLRETLEAFVRGAARPRAYEPTSGGMMLSEPR